MRHLTRAVLLSVAALVGCDKSTATGPPATPSQTAAPAPAAPIIANTESKMPTTAPVGAMPGTGATTMPAPNR